MPDLSFALIGRTPSDCALQASDFRVSTADRVRALSADCPPAPPAKSTRRAPGAPSSALKVSPVNERKRVRFFTASPVIKHEADRGKPGISSPLNKRARQGMSLRFNERTANPGVVFSRPPSGLIGGLPGCRRVGIYGIQGSEPPEHAQFRDSDSQFVGRKDPKFVGFEHNLGNCVARS